MTRVAVIGCGAIADTFHLPGLRRVLDSMDELVLVDPDESRSEELATRHGVSHTARSHDEVVNRIDAAIIASPHHTHVPIAKDLVAAGVPVLSEKPLGVSLDEVVELAELAESRSVVVAVNQTRRFIPAAQELGKLVRSGELGTPLEVEVVEGDRFDWPAATPSMFGARSGGRGLLLDIGVHVLDLMVDWFGSELQVEEYRDDSFGGSEASLLAHLSGADVSIRIRLSWLAKQRNEFVVSGPRGRAHWGIYDLDRVTVDWSGGRRETRRASAPGAFADLAVPVLEDFFAAVRDRTPPAAGPRDVLPTMRMMDECYGRRSRFEMPWHQFDGDLSRAG